MLKQNPRAAVLAAYLVVLPLPALLCIPYLEHLAQAAAIKDADVLAQRALARNEAITSQVRNALEAMAGLQLVHPCGPEALVAMQRVSLTNHHVQAVGHIRDGKFLCSTAGNSLDDVDLGPADIITKTGGEIRSRRRLPFAANATYRISSNMKTGYAVVLHDSSAFDGIDATSKVSTGLVSLEGNLLLTSGADWRPHWTARLGQGLVAGFTDGNAVIALRRSQKYPYYAFASLPLETVDTHFRSMAYVVLLMALVVGALGAHFLTGLIQRRSSLIAQLESAIDSQNQLFLVYQPIVELASQRWVGCEALMRWRTRSGELVSPAIFIPLAAEHGLMRRVTDKMLSLLSDDVRQPLAENDNFFFSVNLGAEDLNDPGIARKLEQAISALGGHVERLRVEVTEHSLLDAKSSAERIAALRAMGLVVSIDDFGTGYSSLSYLTELNANGLKIDKSFVDTIGKDSASSHVIPHIIEMAHAIGLHIVAEGVEEAAQAEYLRKRGVQLGQGWLFAKPMPYSQLTHEWGVQKAYETVTAQQRN